MITPGKYKILRFRTRDGWLRERNNGIGSSEVGVLAKVSRFTTIVGLYRKKKGLTLPEPESDIMKAGHEFEPVAAQKWAEHSGDIMDQTSIDDFLAVSLEKSYMRVSPDRLFWDKSIPAAQRNIRNAYIVECKTTRLEVTKTDYPQSWYFQVQYQMGVMGLKKAVIACLTSSPYLHCVFIEVPFNAAVFEEIEYVITDFWENHIMKNIPPVEVMCSDDAGFLWPDAIKERECIASDDITEEVMEYNTLNAQSRDIEKRMDEIKLHVKEFMKSSAELKTPEGRIIVTWNNRNVADSFEKDRFAQEHPELYKSYIKTGQKSRTILFKKVSPVAS